ncbi:unnamed protein product [Kluyveromyces dobzhanskii CBS 2104]|uniref:Pre-mRNA-splicing factor SLT11 n=1 Tax=Kluyveromyces dobzhanskii CBS 2104 TaxID=1427455 RepID=A0A0A8LBG2_9SACH|nr:unnamed protein product [Kluyveromyces dobzhanskii CBS 2104]
MNQASSELKICERCLPSGKNTPTLVRYPNGRECKLCTFPFDSYSYTSNHTAFHTIACPKCAAKNMICQVCLNDFEHGIPMHLRNAMKQLVNEDADSVIPKNDMMKRFVGLSSKQVAPLDINKLKNADSIRKWKVRELPYHSSINNTKGTFFLYNIDSTLTEPQIVSQLIVVTHNNLERENVVLHINPKFRIATLTFKRDAQLWAQKLISILPKFKTGTAVEKCYLTLRGNRIHLTACTPEELDTQNINLEEEWEGPVKKIISKDAQAIGSDSIKNNQKIKSKSKSKSKANSNPHTKSKSVRGRHRLSL